MKYIEGDIYANTIFSSISEVIAYAISGALFTFLGFRKSFVISFAIAIVGSIFYIIFPDAGDISVAIMILAAKFGISSVFGLVYLAITIFPPIYAATCMGICNLVARIASILAP